MLGVMAEVISSKTYGTLVVDPINEVEQLILTFIANEAGVSHYNDIGGGFYKFRAALVNQWKRFINGLDHLCAAGIQPILIGHTKIKPFSPPDGATYDRYILDFVDESSSSILTKNVDLIGFAKFKTYVKESKDKKGKATTTNEREIHWKYHPAYPSKCGIGCADVTKLDYEDFIKGLNDAASV